MTNSTSWETVLPLGFVPTLVIFFIVGATCMGMIAGGAIYLCCGKGTCVHRVLKNRSDARKQIIAADDASTSTV
jgi:hypothetical protein